MAEVGRTHPRTFELVQGAATGGPQDAPPTPPRPPYASRLDSRLKLRAPDPVTSGRYGGTDASTARPPLTDREDGALPTLQRRARHLRHT